MKKKSDESDEELRRRAKSDAHPNQIYEVDDKGKITFGNGQAGARPPTKPPPTSSGGWMKIMKKAAITTTIVVLVAGCATLGFLYVQESNKLPATETATVTKTTTPAPVMETVTTMVEVTKTVTVTETVTTMVDQSIVTVTDPLVTATTTETVTVTTTPEEGDVIEVEFWDVESEPSVILELKKGGNVVLKVMETLLVEPTLTFYTAIWTPDLGQYYWYAYAEWHKEQPQYTFGFAMTAAAAPDIGNHNTSRSGKVGNVIVSPDGDTDWTDKGDYLELMKTLCEAMEEIGSREDIITLLDSELPGSASELIAEQEHILGEVSSADYDEALAQMAEKLPYLETEIRNPGDVTYEELERVVQAIEASVIVISTAADLVCPNPLAGACFATGNKGGFAIGGFNAA